MAYFEVRPFEVGKTYGMTTAPVTGDPSLAYEGLEVYVEDKDPTQALRRSTRVRKLRVVRNNATANSGGEVTTGNFLPKKLVKFHNPANGTASFYGQRCDGYSVFGAGATNVGQGSSGNERAYPVDEYLPSTGVAINDLFYIVVEGPAMCLMPLAQIADVNVGDPMTSSTAVTSGATTSGRVTNFNYGQATTAAYLEILNVIGRALSATSSSQTTNTGILVDIAPVCR